MLDFVERNETRDVIPHARDNRCAIVRMHEPKPIIKRFTRTLRVPEDGPQRRVHVDRFGVDIPIPDAHSAR
jgi:hypothetical protein